MTRQIPIECQQGHKWETTRREVKYNVHVITQTCQRCGMVRVGTYAPPTPYDDDKIVWAPPVWPEETE